MPSDSIELSSNAVREAKTSYVDDRLYSTDFNDFYAAQSPIQECHLVHIQPAKLGQRMSDNQTFTVFEFGLGPGINFLAIGQAFLQHGLPGNRLRFFSCEASPLPFNVLQDTVRTTASRLELSKEWIEQYPPPIAGLHRRLFADGRIELTMMYVNAESALLDFIARDRIGVDAWILDGFAPDRNPDMWSEELLSSLEKQSRDGATVTTFSAAGQVRRLLAANGFSVEKIPNLPYKRHTTLARLAKSTCVHPVRPSRAVVVGGGFAGCSTAQALARRGIEVELRTSTGKIGDATSAIPTAVVHARLSASSDSAPSIRVHSHAYSQSLIRRSKNAIQCGALQFPSSRMKPERLEGICDLLGPEWTSRVTSKQVTEITGLASCMDSVYFPRTLVVNGRVLCFWFADHPKVKLVQGELPELARVDCPIVVATGTPAPIKELCPTLEFTEIEGQMDQFLPTFEKPVRPIALLHEGYVVCTKDGYSAGSTYEYKPWPKSAARTANQERIDRLIGSVELSHVGSFRSRRTVTSDHMPIAGDVDSNVWVNLAHGSSGTTSAPFCAEIIASEISGEIPPLQQSHMNTLSPDRFEIRQSRRKNPFLSETSDRS